MSRIAMSIAATLIFVIPARAAEPISPREVDSSDIGEIAIDGNADKPRTIIGFWPVRVDPDKPIEFEPIYPPPQAEKRGNIVGVTASGIVVFCFCSGTSF